MALELPTHKDTMCDVHTAVIFIIIQFTVNDYNNCNLMNWLITLYNYQLKWLQRYYILDYSTTTIYSLASLWFAFQPSAASYRLICSRSSACSGGGGRDNTDIWLVIRLLSKPILFYRFTHPLSIAVDLKGSMEPRL